MSDEVVIRVDHVSKNFVLPHDKVTSLKGAFTNLAKGKALKSKETQHALKDVSFEVKKGEFFGIVGRNGSGKSTMLKMLAGIYQPTKGKVNIRGRLVPFIELGVGFNPELTGRENVYLNGAMMGFSSKQVDEMYESIVAFAELEQFMDQKLKNYSSGMQVRLAFSVAIKAEADVLLVDEVLAVGDADFQAKCFDYFRELKGNKKTVILVTHDMNAIRQYCDNAILIENGDILSRGSASKVASDYSKMFVEKANDSSTGGGQTTSKRWGDGAIKYRKFDVPKQLKEGDKLLIKAWAEIKEDVEDPIFGFTLKNASREILIGTNTLVEGQVFGDLKAGSEVYIEWELPNIFISGTHYIDLAAVYKGGPSIADWWDEATKFTVIREKTANFLVSPDIQVKTSTKEK